MTRRSVAAAAANNPGLTLRFRIACCNARERIRVVIVATM